MVGANHREMDWRVDVCAAGGVDWPVGERGDVDFIADCAAEAAAVESGGFSWEGHRGCCKADSGVVLVKFSCASLVS